MSGDEKDEEEVRIETASQYTIYGEIRPGEEDELAEVVAMLMRHGIEPTENEVQNLLKGGR